MEGLQPFEVPSECKSDLVLFTDTQEGRSEVAGIARRGGVLCDIGAHVGFMSAVFCAARPDNRVFCFEPSPILQKRLADLQKFGRLGERTKIEPIAVGRRPLLSRINGSTRTL